jgi:ribonuclease-3
MPRRSPRSATPSTTSSRAPVPDGAGQHPRDLAGLLHLLDADLRQEALTHREWAPRRSGSYERLEFLGDSVLGVIVTAELFSRHPDRTEGELTRMRQRVVSREACAQVADDCGLPQAMVQAAPPSRADDAAAMAARPNVKAALAESVIGAGWIGPGRDATTSAVLGAFAQALDAAPSRMMDPKSTLQELVQGAGGPPVRYEITGHDGPPQDRTFHARVLRGDQVLGSGSGRSKQAAEQQAAAAALQAMGEGA